MNLEKIFVFIIYPVIFLLLILKLFFFNPGGKTVSPNTINELQASNGNSQSINQETRARVDTSLELNRETGKGIENLQSLNREFERFIQEN